MDRCPFCLSRLAGVAKGRHCRVCRCTFSASCLPEWLVATLNRIERWLMPGEDRLCVCLSARWSFVQLVRLRDIDAWWRRQRHV